MRTKRSIAISALIRLYMEACHYGPEGRGAELEEIDDDYRIVLDYIKDLEKNVEKGKSRAPEYTYVGNHIDHERRVTENDES